MTDKTIPNRNNRLKSEMTTLGPTCRLLGFIKMGDFPPVNVETTTLTRFMHQPFVYPPPWGEGGACLPET